jgi:phosphonate transport system ATP-binding protein
MSFHLQAAGLAHANGHRALNRLSLDAKSGERIAVIGPSGAGKTSLLRLLATSLRPTEGRIGVLDANPWQLGARELRRLRSRVGVVHQAPPLPPRQRAVTAILAGRLGRWPWWKSLLSLWYPADIAGARAQLARLDLADRLFERCDRLSGGQLQRVGVARVLYQQPELILADEPVSAMDPALADLTISQLSQEATARGVTLVASLHAVDLALRWFPRIVGLKGGEIQFDLPPVKVDDALLRELYATESSVIPTQDREPLVLPEPGVSDAGAPRRTQCW